MQTSVIVAWALGSGSVAVAQVLVAPRYVRSSWANSQKYVPCIGSSSLPLGLEEVYQLIIFTKCNAVCQALQLHSF